MSRRHHTADRHLADLAHTNLDELGRRVHLLIELNFRHPSTPDGYPTHTPGAAPATTTPTTNPRDDDDGPFELTSVERAATQRTRDELAAAEDLILHHLETAARALVNITRILDDTDRLRHTQPTTDLDAGCWAMARIGAWEPTHRTTDLADIAHANLDEPRRLGRWAYDFARRQGRLPTIDECRRHQAGQRVMVAAA